MKGGSRLNSALLYFFGICLTILFILITSVYLSFFGVEMISFIQEVSDTSNGMNINMQVTNLSFAYRISNGKVMEVREIHHMTRNYIEGSSYVESFYRDIEELMSNTYSVVCVKILSMNTFYIERDGETTYISTIYTVEVVEVMSGAQVPKKIKIEVVDQGYSFAEGSFKARKYLPIFRPGEEWILFLTGKAIDKKVYNDIGLVDNLSNLYSFSFPLKLVDNSVYSLDVLTGYPLHLPASFNGTSIEEFMEIIESAASQ